MQKDRKNLVISAIVFSVIHIILMLVSNDFYTALVSIILWGCMCFGQSWARASKIMLDGVLICVYVVSLWQIFIQYKNTGNMPDIDISFIVMMIINVAVPVAEIIVIYKSKSISSYFIDMKKNKINTNIKR